MCAYGIFDMDINNIDKNINNINKRRLMLYIKDCIEKTAESFVRDPIDDVAKLAFRNTISNLLNDLICRHAIFDYNMMPGEPLLLYGIKDGQLVDPSIPNIELVVRCPDGRIYSIESECFVRDFDSPHASFLITEKQIKEMIEKGHVQIGESDCGDVLSLTIDIKPTLTAEFVRLNVVL